jgi:hypothetical protein
MSQIDERFKSLVSEILVDPAKQQEELKYTFRMTEEEVKEVSLVSLNFSSLKNIY